MTVTRYNTEAMEACRMAVSGAAGPLRAVGEGLGSTCIDSGACGSYAGATGVGPALEWLVSTLAGEYAVGGQRLDDTAVALDAARTAVEDTDAANADGFATRPAA